MRQTDRAAKVRGANQFDPAHRPSGLQIDIIEALTLIPDAPLDAPRLAALLGCGSTKVRAALRVLHKHGWIVPDHKNTWRLYVPPQR